MKYCPVGSYLVMKSTPWVPGDRTFMAIGYKYNYWKILLFIDTYGGVIDYTADTCLSHLPYHYSNFSVCPVSVLL